MFLSLTLVFFYFFFFVEFLVFFSILTLSLDSLRAHYNVVITTKVTDIIHKDCQVATVATRKLKEISSSHIHMRLYTFELVCSHSGRFSAMMPLNIYNASKKR